MCPVEAPVSDSQRCQPQTANLNADGTSRSAHGSQSTRQSLRSVEDQSRGGTLRCTFSVAIQKDLWSRLPSSDQMGCYFNKGLTFCPQKGGIIQHINKRCRCSFFSISTIWLVVTCHFLHNNNSNTELRKSTPLDRWLTSAKI